MSLGGNGLGVRRRFPETPLTPCDGDHQLGPGNPWWHFFPKWWGKSPQAALWGGAIHSTPGGNGGAIRTRDPAGSSCFLRRVKKKIFEFLMIHANGGDPYQDASICGTSFANGISSRGCLEAGRFAPGPQCERESRHVCHA